MSNHYDEPMENGMLLRTFSAKNHTAVCSEILMGFLNEHGGFTVRGFGDYLNIPGQWSGMVSAAVTLKSFLACRVTEQ